MQRAAAFSLVELSIVLVILGLLTGGILAGRSLVRASEMRTVSTDYSRYVSATRAFRDKYFALPGDFTNATGFWGTAAACPGLAAEGSTTAATCNGNGNNAIYTATTSSEIFRYWQHLANAGMIEGSYSGVTANDAYYWTVSSTNSPASKIGSSAVWTVTTMDNTSGGFTGSLWRQNYGHFLLIGGAQSASWPSVSVMTADEAWNIDTKLDDSKPASGKVHGKASGSCTDSNDNTVPATAYNLSATGKTCILIFPHAF